MKTLLRYIFLFTILVTIAPLRAAAIPPSALIEATDSALTSRDGTAYVVTRARVRVPEQRTNPTSSMIELAVVRVRRAGAPASSRVHMLLAGGPGDSGVKQVLEMARLGGTALAQFIDGDLIGIDQRGIGDSRPSLLSDVSYGLPLEAEGSPTAWLPLIEKATRDVAADFRGRGIALEAYNTEESADDVEAVRTAFGYGPMTLWGRSYGTHLALATTRRHPGSVERMILVSPLGPDHKWKLPSQVDTVLERIAARAGSPSMTEHLRQVLAQLRRQPVHVALLDPVTQKQRNMTIGAFDVQWAIAQAIGNSAAVATLPAAVEEMHQGNFRRVAQLSLALRRQLRIISAMNHMMNLSSGESPGRRERIDREAATALLGDTINFPGRYLEASWGARALGPEFAQPVISSVPTLILVGDLDARTPSENGREIAATLKNSHLVVVENAAHEFNLFGSVELRSLLGRFTRGEQPGTHRISLAPLSFDVPRSASPEAP